MVHISEMLPNIMRSKTFSLKNVAELTTKKMGKKVQGTKRLFVVDGNAVYLVFRGRIQSMWLLSQSGNTDQVVP